MNKVCQRCNELNPTEASFCRNCSTPLPKETIIGGYGTLPPPDPNWNQGNIHQPLSPASVEKTSKAVIGVILFILSFFLCGLTAIPAAIVGAMELSAIKRGESPQSNKPLALVSLIGGVVITVSVLGVLFYILLMAVAVSSDPYAY